MHEQRTTEREFARDFVSTIDIYVHCEYAMLYRGANRRSYVAKPRRTSQCGRSSRGNSRRDSLRNLWKALGKLSLRGSRSKTVFGSRVRIHTCIKCKFKPCQACSFSASGLSFSYDRHKSRLALWATSLDE